MLALRFGGPAYLGPVKNLQRPSSKPKFSKISKLAFRVFSRGFNEVHKIDYIKLTELEIGPDTFLEREYECHQKEIRSANRVSICSALTLLFLGAVLSQMSGKDDEVVLSTEKMISEEFGELD